ncbi:MAG TPA: PAS domain S-box protein, partial [Polyangiaceae bacterium]|nr:PAS domain S-box protein [Polyangiaceae bacterium]
MSVSKGDTSAAGGRRAARWHTAWAVLLVSSTLVAAAIGVALLAETTATRRLFDNVHWTLSYGTAALLAWFGAARSRQEERRARRLFAWALTSYFVGQVLWDIQVAIALNPFPGPSDLFYFGTGLLMGWGVLSCVRQHVPTSDRRTALLDLAALFTASLALALAVCLPRRGNTEPFALVVLIAYPLVLSLTAVSATILLLWARIAPRLGWWLFLSGLWLNWYLWLEWNFRTLAGTLADGTLYNALFSVDALVLGAGVWLLELEPSRGERLRPRATTWLRLLPLLSVVIGAGAVVLAVTLSHVAPLARLLAISGGLVVVLLASLRQLAQLDAHEQLIAAEQQLNRVETSYRLLVEQAVDGIFITDGRGVYVNVNQRGAQMLRARPEELIGLSIADVLPEHELPRLEGAIGELHAGKEMGQRWQLRRRDNTLFDAEITAKKLPDGRLQGLVRDISEQVALEGQLRQAQKMEAIGSLAAGIAHDFNNLLGAIQGNAELAQDEVGERHPAFESIGEIRKATQRAAALVRQILSFSR